MSTVIKTVGHHQHKFKSDLPIFGYSTHSVPGLEIIGLGKDSRYLKEKLIYLTKQREIKIPLKRYVLCLERGAGDQKFEMDDYKFLEFPLLTLYWSMAGVIPLKRLEGMYAIGAVSLSGEVLMPKPELISSWTEGEIKYICPSEQSLPVNIKSFPVEAIFSAEHKLNFKWLEYEPIR